MITSFKQNSVEFKPRVKLNCSIFFELVFWFSRNADEPQMTDEERLQAIANQYAVLRNKTSGRT